MFTLDQGNCGEGSYCDAFFAYNCFQCRKGAVVGWAQGRAVREGVGNGPYMELESDFDDIEGSYAESVCGQCIESSRME